MTWRFRNPKRKSKRWDLRVLLRNNSFLRKAAFSKKKCII